MAKIYRVIQMNWISLTKSPHDHWPTNKVFLALSQWQTFLRAFAYKMAAKINWHRYAPKLRYCHPVYTADVKASVAFYRAVIFSRATSHDPMRCRSASVNSCCSIETAVLNRSSWFLSKEASFQLSYTVFEGNSSTDKNTDTLPLELNCEL